MRGWIQKAPAERPSLHTRANRFSDLFNQLTYKTAEPWGKETWDRYLWRHECEDRRESSRHSLLWAGQAVGHVMVGGPGDRGAALGTVSLVGRENRRGHRESGGTLKPYVACDIVYLQPNLLCLSSARLSLSMSILLTNAPLFSAQCTNITTCVWECWELY